MRRAIGLDEDRAWIVVSEHNVDEWPIAGLAPVPGAPDRYHYGHIPPTLFAQVKALFVALAESGRTARVVRDP